MVITVLQFYFSWRQPSDYIPLKGLNFPVRLQLTFLPALPLNIILLGWLYMQASFLSLNLNALAEHLAKVDLSQRLFVEADLLPSESVIYVNTYHLLHRIHECYFKLLMF